MNTFTSLVALITMIVIVYSVFLKKKNNDNTTGCHPKTDNFDFWCLKEIGKGWFSSKIIDDSCDLEQRKSKCKKNS